MIKIAMMLLKHQQINLKNGNTSNTEEINNTSSGENNNTPENKKMFFDIKFYSFVVKFIHSRLIISRPPYLISVNF